jgi:hypothetical protein
VNPDWLVECLRNPQSYLPHSQMPRYQWSDRNLYLVTQYVAAKLTDPSLLSDLPKRDAPSTDEIQIGRQGAGSITNFSHFPMLNIQLGVQDTGYTRFNGAAINYDGAGRNASGNITCYLLARFIF